jgi:hypothetical protein
VTTDLRLGCTEAHTGTSASAPLAAAMCALALEAKYGLLVNNNFYNVKDLLVCAFDLFVKLQTCVCM